MMKNTRIPHLNVTANVRQAAESVLEEGETLSSFVEDSIRTQVERRRAKRDFINRGLASRDEARITGEYYGADSVVRELDELLTQAKVKEPK